MASTIRRVEGAPPVLEQAAVGDLVGQRVLEGVLEVRDEPGLVQELGGLQGREPTSQRVLGDVRDGLQEGERHVLADDRGRLEERLASGGSRSIRAARTASTVAGTWIASIGRAR